MKQLIQSYKSGELGLFEVPAPLVHDGGVLVATRASLVSAGTEKMIVDIAKKSLLGKAAARPDLVRQVVDKVKQEGLKNTLEKVSSKLDTPVPLGYSCAGEVIEAGKGVKGVSVGDRVACGGAGYATHGEINYVPRNLITAIPKGVSDEEAAFVTVGAIALQGVRQADPRLGERIAVIGLGLIGQVTVQLLKANGCTVLGSDPDEGKRTLAVELGADVVCGPDELVEAAQGFSGGRSVDGVIVTASTKSNGPVADAGEISRHKGVVVVVGLVGMDIPRDIYYRKELDLRLSMSYGPGRYDPGYEEKGIDYPFSYVRWTEGRNFEAFLDLVARGKVTPKSLITHCFPFADALKAYGLLDGKVDEPYLGIVLEYPPKEKISRERVIRGGAVPVRGKTDDELSVGLIGAGNFTKGVLLPKLAKINGVRLTGISAASGLSARTVGDKFGFGITATDGEALIADESVNTIFVTTRHDSHARYVIAALKAGKHVFVEKPMCISVEELEKIVKARKESEKSGANPRLMVGFNRRFAPLVRAMKEEAGDGPRTVLYRVSAGAVPADSWVQDRDQGGGRIIGEVCHFVDTCSYLAGSLPASVSATAVRTGDASIPDADIASILLAFENGSTATILYTAYGNRQVPKERVELFGRNLVMEMDDFRRLTVFRGQKKKVHRSAAQDKGFAAELAAFAESVKSGVDPIPFSSLERTTRTTFAVLESLRSGETERL